MRTSESLRRGVLWTWLATSGFVAIEPSPFEAIFPIALIVFADGGMLFDRALAPLIFCLFAYDASGLISLIPWYDEKASFNFIFITIYISLATVTISALVAAAPQARMATIRSGYVAAGVVSAFLGVIGYFNVAGTGAYFTMYDNTRAMGFFKDPNVFGPFLAPPIVWLFQDLLLRRSSPLIPIACLAMMLAGVLLSFSRGAIADCLLSILLVLSLTFLTSASAKMRARTVRVGLLGVALMVAIGVLAFSIPAVRELALERATLQQDYDSGEQGRFGNQLRSIPMLLDRPLGFGPQRFSHYFPIDPHEVFLSAFSSLGWSGGIAFTTFFLTTIYFGWRLCFRRTPLQGEAIAVWSALFPQMLQGFQIDTNHWRHMFLMIACIYGLTAAERLRAPAARRLSENEGGSRDPHLRKARLGVGLEA